MLTAIACLIGIYFLLAMSELLSKYKILKGEYSRKSLHIAAGSFIAFWPWLISWQMIQLLGLIMLGVILLIRYFSVYKYRSSIRRASYGDILLALAVTLCATFTHNKIFFMIAILQVAIADGIAALVGVSYGKKWDYKVFGNKKTVIGSMGFWMTSLCILGVGLLPANNTISLHSYYLALLFLPPLFTLLENAAVMGLDNIVLPLLTIVFLSVLQA